MVAFCDRSEEIFVDGTYYDIRPYLRDMMEMASEVQWFKDQFSIFNGNFQPFFAEVQTQRGMGFSFNLMDFNDLLNVDK